MHSFLDLRQSNLIMKNISFENMVIISNEKFIRFNGTNSTTNYFIAENLNFNNFSLSNSIPLFESYSESMIVVINNIKGANVTMDGKLLIFLVK